MSSPDRETLITDSQGQTQLHEGIALVGNMPNLKCLLFFKTPPYFLCHLYLLKHLSYFGICLNTKCIAKFSSMKSPQFTARLKVLSHKAVYLLSHTHKMEDVNIGVMLISHCKTNTCTYFQLHLP